MTVVRVFLALAASLSCFGAAFVVSKCRGSWILFGGACFWLFGGNLLILEFNLHADHPVRWSPFYWMVIAAAVLAVVETSLSNKKRARIEQSAADSKAKG